MYQVFSQPAPVMFGRGAISVLGEKIKEFGCKKALLVCEQGIVDAGIIDKAAASLAAAGVGHAVFSGVLADPPDSCVEAAAQAAREAEADCIVGIGGGSSMDTAKAASILMNHPGTIRTYMTAMPTFMEVETPLFLVPTTAGTGSECTSVAIISLPDQNVKAGVFISAPRSLAIVDPELTLSLPRSITASTGMDALAHAAEAMTAVNWNYHSDLFGEAAIRKISQNLVICCDDPSNIDARSEMALAANWAGLAFNNPITHVAHAVADAFSVHFHTPHGLGCALALPETMALVAPVMPERMFVIAKAMGLASSGSESGERLGKIVADGMRDMMRKAGIKSLSEMGYEREEVVSFITEVVTSHLSFNCPVEINEETAAKLLAAVFDTY